MKAIFRLNVFYVSNQGGASASLSFSAALKLKSNYSFYEDLINLALEAEIRCHTALLAIC